MSIIEIGFLALFVVFWLIVFGLRWLTGRTDRETDELLVFLSKLRKEPR